ncbi:helix-turn-helix transcriptional regulator [Acidovorax sp.]|jgi:prophage regulatory protein|uniref:helix-turn-helix transcriptional regulator n=1 Tax=Acidovorax sp. TaxID=1872122 RepID=UPI00391FAE02
MQVVHQARPVVPRDRLVRLPEVEEMTGCKKSTIYELMRAGKFPKSVRLNARMVAWPETAVLQWVQDRIAEAQQSTGVQQ